MHKLLDELEQTKRELATAKETIERLIAENKALMDKYEREQHQQYTKASKKRKSSARVEFEEHSQPLSVKPSGSDHRRSESVPPISMHPLPVPPTVVGAIHPLLHSPTSQQIDRKIEASISSSGCAKRRRTRSRTVDIAKNSRISSSAGDLYDFFF